MLNLYLFFSFYSGPIPPGSAGKASSLLPSNPVIEDRTDTDYPTAEDNQSWSSTISGIPSLLLL